MVYASPTPKLEELAVAFEQNPDCGFVYSDNATYHMQDAFIPYNPLFGWTYKNYDWNSHFHFDPTYSDDFYTLGPQKLFGWPIFLII